jgi:hypothetical protein
MKERARLLFYCSSNLFQVLLKRRRGGRGGRRGSSSSSSSPISCRCCYIASTEMNIEARVRVAVL